jgi:hypothetical protein
MFAHMLLSASSTVQVVILFRHEDNHTAVSWLPILVVFKAQACGEQ